MEARLCNHCCSGKTLNITYFECVFVALGIWREVRMSILLSASLFFHIIS